jgi:glycerate kinase
MAGTEDVTSDLVAEMIRTLSGHRQDRVVLVAPDSFKGTYSARQVAAALAAGFRAADYEVDQCPIADGGEGTMDALLDDGQLRSATVEDPLGRPIEARFGIRDAIGIVEMAAASGLGLVAPEERDAINASTSGTGELIASAIAAGAKTVYLGVGGSATTDGGAGAVAALAARGGLHGSRLVVLCDVETTFEDAAQVFGPQKGADPQQSRSSLVGCTHKQRRIRRTRAVFPGQVPPAGWQADYGRRLVLSSSAVLALCWTRLGSMPGARRPPRS